MKIADVRVYDIRFPTRRALAPLRPGYRITMTPESLEAYEFPAGEVWRELQAAAMA